MRRLLLLSCALALAGCATPLPRDARLGVVDGLAPGVSAAIGKAAASTPAPTVRDDWHLAATAQTDTVTRLAGLGYRAEATRLPAALEATIARGGALRSEFAGVSLDEQFSRELASWMRTQGYDGVVVLRSLARPLEAGAPIEGGYGIARRGAATVAYANLGLLLIEGGTPTLQAAPQCLVSTPVDGVLVAGASSTTELAPLLPAIEGVLRQAIDGSLIRAGVMQGNAACE